MKMARPSGGEERTPEKYVFLIELAEFIGFSNSAFQAKMKRSGITLRKVPRDGSGKLAWAMSAKDAKRIIEQRPPKAETISPADLMKG